jgi:dTDP-L-rhamnose 4-epimerase
MRVLLTGAAGFIGRHVHAELLARDHDVVALDSLRADVHRRRPIDIPGLVVADVRDAAEVGDAMRGVDAVCHLAAKVGLGIDIDDMPDYAASNDHATAVVLAAMARAGARRLVLASSMVVYGEGSGRCPEHGSITPAPRDSAALQAGRFEPPCPTCGRELAPELVAEGAAVDPRSAYASSKLAQENYATSWARVTGGAVAALRYHNVYGPAMPRHTPYAGVAAIFLSALLRGEPPTVFEDGRQRRDFVHVRDVAAATVRALERHDSGIRAYNVGSGVPRTVGEVAAALSHAVDGPAPTVTGRYRLGDVRHITADSSRIRTELGWEPRFDFDAGMAELAADFEPARLVTSG